MSEEIVIDLGYGGYTYMGHAQGKMEVDQEQPDGTFKRPYFQLFVVSPVSDFKSDDYDATGLKAEKLRCTGPDVWDGLKPGDKVKLFFDDKRRVQMVAFDG